MTTERRIPYKHYAKLPKGMFTDIEKIISVLYTNGKPVDTSYSFIKSIAVDNRNNDIYVYRDCGYCNNKCQPPTGYKQYFIDSLGGL